MAKKKKVKLTKLSKKIIFYVIGIAAIYFLITYPFALELKGDKRITIEVFDEYIEQGINQKVGSKYKTIGTVDTTTIGTYKIKYRWLLETITRTVKVVDSQAPQLILNSEADEYIQLNVDYNDPGVKAIDNYDGDISANVVTKAKVNTNKIGDYEVKYSVEDSSGNKATITKNVHVIDDSLKYQLNLDKDYGIDNNVIQTIIDLKNNYYFNMKYLINSRCGSLFGSDEYQYMYYKLTDINVQMHKDAPIDLTINSVKYDLTVTNFEELDNGYYVELIEKYEIVYNYYLENTNISEIECSYWLDKDYKITEFERGEGCFYYIYEDYESSNDWKTSIDDITNEYYTKRKANIDSYLIDLERINNNELSLNDVISARSNYRYDREDAVDYAEKYVFKKNNDYFYINSNNCVNFVSQCLHAGGLPMVTSGDNQWKNYDYYVNEDDGADGFTYSWTATGYFMDFLKYSNKIIAQIHITPFLAEPGDVMMFGSSKDSLSHATIVTGIIKDGEGKIIDILFSGNTNNALNLSILANTGYYYECEKIVGYN